jgi:hypothetical protein
MGTRPAPSDEARARLREEAQTLDVEDIVDLCCSARQHDDLRVSIYLDALRKKPGEKAQLAACMLCFELARHGDARRDVEVQLLLPVVEELGHTDPRGLVKSLTDKSDAVLALWSELLSLARTRDARTTSPVPTLDDDDEAIDVDLFADADLVDLDAALEGVLDATFVDAEAQDAFDGAFDRQWSPGALLFSAESGADIDRLEKLQESARSWSSSVPMAAELQALNALFVATHTRALGLVGRRNQKRDAALREALVAFVNLPSPPAFTAAWFIPGGDVPGAVPYAWDKMAELLIDFAGHVGRSVEAGANVDAADFVEFTVDDYVKQPSSSSVPPLLAPPGQRRRR